MFARKRLLVVAGLLAAVGAIAGIAIAQIPYGGVITGCYTKSGGGLRVIDAQSTNCTTKETRLDWNQKGPAGTDGTNGTNGAPGVSGYEIVTSSDTDSNSSYAVREVACPAGKKAIGGGGRIARSTSDSTNNLPAKEYDVVSSYPTPNGAGWGAGFVVTALDATPYVRTVYAICATVS